MDHDHFNWVLHWFGNVASLGAIAGTLWGIFPGIAALIAFIWYMIQIYESATFQKWLTGRRQRKIDRLRARITELLDDELMSKPDE